MLEEERRLGSHIQLVLGLLVALQDRPGTARLEEHKAVPKQAITVSNHDRNKKVAR